MTPFRKYLEQTLRLGHFGQRLKILIIPGLKSAIDSLAKRDHLEPDALLNVLLIEALRARANKAAKNTPNLNGFPTKRGMIKT